MAQEERSQGEEQSQQPVELFSDVFWTHVSPWSAAVTFGLRKTSPDESDTYKTRVRMSLQQAKALSLMLLQGIRQYEKQTGARVQLPTDVLEGLHIPVADWEQL